MFCSENYLFHVSHVVILGSLYIRSWLQAGAVCPLKNKKKLERCAR